MNKLKIYLAASFAFPDKELSEQRKEHIKKAATILRDRGFEVFVPHEHKIPGGEEMSNVVWGCAVQQMDKENLKNADWIVMLSFGKLGNNAGVAWEAGYAAGLGKKILLVKMNRDRESMMVWFNVTAHVWELPGLQRFNFENPDTWDLILDGIELS